ncbi:MAG: hypothetical protein V1725_02795 [archaeon]
MIRKGDERDILVTKFEIDVDDVFHLKNLYKTIYEWTKIEGWKAADGNGEPEMLYWERRTQVTEHQIWWRFMMKPDNNTYFTYFLKIDYQTLAMGGTEVPYDGKKIKSNKGEVILRVQAWLLVDPDNKWDDATFLKQIERIFRKRIYKQQIEDYKKRLEIITERLRNTIKTYLQLQMPYTPLKPFMPERGV